ncbi:hypothetical protein [Burkholderia contaminans]|uniref:hypothetical protein n=2 Tax=Burkholderia contaminans TaxID=488447 RepID=UPI001FC8EB1D|nr:hypothetical protein [Burkholderia contaminans]
MPVPTRAGMMGAAPSHACRLRSIPPLTSAHPGLCAHSERWSLSRWAGIAVAPFGALGVIGRGELLRVLTDLDNTFGSGEPFMMCAALMPRNARFGDGCEIPERSTAAIAAPLRDAYARPIRPPMFSQHRQKPPIVN